MSKIRVSRGAVGVFAVLALLAAWPAPAQVSCFSTSGPELDICSAVDTQYYSSSIKYVAAGTYNGHAYAVVTMPSRLNVFDVTSPRSPLLLVNGQSPLWTFNSEGNHTALTTHVLTPSMADGIPYAYVPLRNWGWDWVRVTPNPGFVGTGYHPATFLDSNISNGSVVNIAGKGYLVGQGLDVASYESGDQNIYMYKVYDPPSVTPETVTAVTMGAIKIRVPLGGAADGAGFSGFDLSSAYAMKAWSYSTGGSNYLIVAASGAGGIFKVTPSPVAGSLTLTPVKYFGSGGFTDSGLGQGPWAVDAAHARILVAGNKTAFIYDISDPTNPRTMSSLVWNPNTTNRAMVAAAAGDLFVCGYSNWLGYIALGGSAPTLVTPDDNNYTFLTRTCTENVGGEAVLGLGVANLNGVPITVRGLNASADVITVSGACLSSTPSPNVGITRTTTTTGTPSCPSNYLSAFPGDTLTLTNTSGGTWVDSRVRVALKSDPNTALKCWSTRTGDVAGSNQLACETWNNESVPWPTGSSRAPGDYQVDITLWDAAGAPYDSTDSEFLKSQYFTLCGNEKAGVQASPTTYLTGDTVTVSAAVPPSEGTPSGWNWLIVGPPPDYTPTTGNNTTQAVTLSLTGAYYAVAVVHYAHPGTSGEISNCDSTIGDSSVKTAVDGFLAVHDDAAKHDACAWLKLDSQPFNVGAISVTQGSNTSPFLLSQAINLAASYKVSSVYTPTTMVYQVYTGSPSFTTPVGSPIPATLSNGVASGQIAGSSLQPAGNPYRVHLQAIATNNANANDTVDQSKDSATFTVQDCVPPVDASLSLVAPANNASVTAGTSVPFQWKVVDNSTPPFDFTVYSTSPGPSGPILTPLCSVTNSSPAVGGTVSCSARISATVTWFVQATDNCSQSPAESSTRTLTATSSGGGGGGGGGDTCTAPTVTGFSTNPTTILAGTPVTFTAQASPVDASTSYAWLITSGIVTIASRSGNPLTYTFSAPGTFTVALSATNSTCTSDTFSRSVTVGTSCASTTPVAAFSYSPSKPKAGEAVSFTDTSVNGPDTWSWNFGANLIAFPNTSNQKNPTTTYSTAGTYTVTLTASNCAGSSAPATAQITIAPQCGADDKPVADFTWAPVNAADVSAKFPGQQQPYVGQQVQLTDASTNGPTQWNWWDFSEGVSSAAGITTQNPVYTWSKSPGPKNVRMWSKNCVGQSGDVTHVITIYADQRPVTADFTIGDGSSSSSSDPAQSPASDAFTTGNPLVFTAMTGFDYGDPSTFTWNFGDGSDPVTTQDHTTTHVFNCRGTYTITLRAERSGYTAEASKPLAVDGEICGPEAVVAPGAAKVPGYNGTEWHTDLYLFNPSDGATQVWAAALPAGQSTPNPVPVGPLTLFPKGSALVRDVLGTYFPQYTKAALRITFTNDEDIAPVVTSRTFTTSDGGGTFGQSVPGIPVTKDPSPSPQWLTGLRNTGLDDGFRTNIGLNQLRGDAGDAKGVTLTLFDADGYVRGMKVLDLAPNGYVQDTLTNLFGPSVGDIGPCTLKVDVPDGKQVMAWYSEVDNRTGDPFLATGGPVPSGPITIAGAAHLAGEAGTVWRTDVQLQNPDAASHAWQLTFYPKGDLPIVSRTVTLPANQGTLIEDVEQWIYNPFDAPDASGVIRIDVADGGSVMPVVQARTYNLTATGTYGQNLAPLQASQGATQGGQFTRMYLTGMSSETVARTNLGFVNLGSKTVNFEVLFYDAMGNLLNPGGAPYTIAVPVNGWDQDKLENRFHNFFKADFPAGLTVVSAEVHVTSNGPGFVYASTIDPVTGDPIFIPGQLAP